MTSVIDPVPRIADSRLPTGQPPNPGIPAGRAAPPSGKSGPRAPAVSSPDRKPGTPLLRELPHARAGAGFGEHWPRSAARRPRRGTGERVSERRSRSRDGCARSHRCASIARTSFRRGSDIRGADHRHPIRSAGQITAQVTENIYDSPAGPYLACAASTHCSRAITTTTCSSARAESCSSGLGSSLNRLDRSRAPAWC